MKRLMYHALSIPLLLSAFSLQPSAFGQTPVLFPVNSLFGGAAYNQPITLTAANTLISDGQNLWAGTYTIIPAATTNPVVNLYPNTYLLTVAGVVKPVRFTVPASTNVLDVTTLLTSGPLFYFGTNGLANLLAGTNILLTTNFDGSITISGTGDPAGAALAATNGLGAGAFMSASTLVTNAAITNSLTPQHSKQHTIHPLRIAFWFCCHRMQGIRNMDRFFTWYSIAHEAFSASEHIPNRSRIRQLLWI